MWYETDYYPVLPESEEWKQCDYLDSLAILNPPRDLLERFSTTELVELLLDYPYLNRIFMYEYEELFFCFLENNCDIYSELLTREDGVTCLLRKYQDSNFEKNLDLDKPYTEENNYRVIINEIFFAQFCEKNKARFDEPDIKLMEQIKLERSSIYSNLPKGLIKAYLQADDGDKETKTLESVNALPYELASTTNGFSATGTPHVREIMGTQIMFTPGNYSKYGASAECEQWYSGDYTEEDRQLLDAGLDGNGWSRLSRSSPKYNCHAYAWLNANAGNGYWLDHPEAYMNSSGIQYIGKNVTPQVGDIVVMYNQYYGYLAHSAVICTPPSGVSKTYTISKFGGQGLYSASLEDVMNHYSSVDYYVYRK